MYLNTGESVVSFFSKELERTSSTQQGSFTYTGSHAYIIWGAHLLPFSPGQVGAMFLPRVVEKDT